VKAYYLDLGLVDYETLIVFSTVIPYQYSKSCKKLKEMMKVDGK
jgi:hypothetical protein